MNIDLETTNIQETHNEDSKVSDQPSGFILKLFQMVNGAPDEVISWTPSGDAFIIGSDLRRLEFETLPKFFRHNRFQSLVRQLNFYSFRKINRERNVWVYKHQLFHRDHPEKLHLVRRRTCPGMDGRKQRISRVSSERFKTELSDESSVEMPPLPTSSLGRKRVVSDQKAPPSKRFRGANNPPVDTSLLGSDDGEDFSLGRRFEDENSLSVSDVASQLEKYARKSSKGRTTGRSRSGIVTPPTSRSLLTYDDEFMLNESIEDRFCSARRISMEEFSGVIDENSVEATSNADDDSLASPKDVAVSGEVVVSPPVRDCETVESILDRMMSSLEGETKTNFILFAAVVGFCMSNAPHGERSLCDKISQLLSTCGPLESEFQSYRMALHPTDKIGAESGKVTWKSAASRSAALRDFKTFACNCVQTVLGHDGNVLDLPVDDKDTLQKTAAIWLKSM